VSGPNPRQHSPNGEPPPGFHPSQHWDPLEHAERGQALYARYLRPGDLAFDIGANVGQRTGWFLELGCRVVAVEPQLGQFEHIPTAAARVLAAVGAVEGSATFYVCANTPYLSTLSAEYVDQVHALPGTPGKMYTDTQVKVVTMDSLIGRYGEPQFAKIDVEGSELGVLEGLSSPLRALSFEVHEFSPDKTEHCLARLAELGTYHFRYSRLESFVLEPWPPRGEISVYGDIYAVLQDPSRP
jgi:FkbM family methyltransferase